MYRYNTKNISSKPVRAQPMMGSGTVKVLQINEIDPRIVHSIIISTYSSTSFQDAARNARKAAIASIIRNDPTSRLAAGSSGQPVIALYESGDRKAHTPNMIEVMKPSRNTYFAKLGISPLISNHTF
jgi:hypothetical protein